MDVAANRLTWIKAEEGGAAHDHRVNKEPVMPASNLPILFAIVGAFATFMGVVGGVHLWCALEPAVENDVSRR